MRLLLDTNIVLDVLLARTPWVESTQRLWQAHDEGSIFGYLSASSLTDIFYIVRRATDLHRAKAAVVICIETFDICPVTRSTLQAALTMPGTDFEDNVTMACAVEGLLYGVVTRDSGDFTDSPIPVYTVEEVLTRLDQSS